MNNCAEHGTPFKLIPAGVSKNTGRPYDAFYACETKGCKNKPNQNAPVSPQKHLEGNKIDWDELAVGKCQSLFLAAYIESGHTFNETILQAGLAKKLAEMVVYGHSVSELPKETMPVAKLSEDGFIRTEEVSVEDIPF